MRTIASLQLSIPSEGQLCTTDKFAAAGARCTRSRVAFRTRPSSRCCLAGVLALILVLLPACDSGGGIDPIGSAGAVIEVAFSGMRPLDPLREGNYEAWVLDAAGRAYSAGTFVLPADGRVQLVNPVADGVALEITVEPPGDDDPAPSAQRLLQGSFRGGRAELSVVGAVTQSNLPLREQPGQFTMYFSPSDNAQNGFPSHEESGVWLFNIAPRETQQADGWVRLTQLRDGWVYEGWVVRDFGTPQAIWLSYGKFLPDAQGALNTRDDTGWGPFSGVRDYRTAGEEEFPGDDWISNPLGYPFPEELSLPLDLKETAPDGKPRWSHIITIEPAWNQGEPITEERPFLLQPYRDPFAARVQGLERPYGLPNPITLHQEGLPRGLAEVR